jgi:DNA-binding NarL/FixJ family response regulator
MTKNCITPPVPKGMPSPVRTLIVDDSHVILTCLREFLDTQAHIQVVGTAADGIEALDRAAVLTPDLVLMDLRMPLMDGLQATVLLRQRLPDTRIIIMTMDETTVASAAARVHGAHGFVGKARLHSALMAEIRLVFRGK